MRDERETEITMPFGLWRGVPLASIDSQYLRWLSRLDWVRDPLRGRVLRELARRGQGGTAQDIPRDVHDDVHDQDVPDPSIILALIDAGLRTLTTRLGETLFGGDEAELRQIKRAATWLRQRVSSPDRVRARP